MQPLSNRSHASLTTLLKALFSTTQEDGGRYVRFLDRGASGLFGKFVNTVSGVVRSRAVHSVVLYLFAMSLLGHNTIAVAATSVSKPGLLEPASFQSAQRLVFQRLDRFESESREPSIKLAVANGAGFLTLRQKADISDSEPTGSYVISDVVIDRQSIFGGNSNESASVRFLYRLVDALHVTTREKTILREIGVGPGDRLSALDVAELERNLRALTLFAVVTAELVPVDNTNAQLHISTRDRVSAVFGASGSFLGGIGSLGFTAGERNVNGTGDRLLLSFSGTSDGEVRGAVSYDDIHFVDGRHTASYSIGSTEEGGFFQLRFSRPFKTRASKFSWTATVQSIEDEADFFESGISVAQVPRQRDSLIFEYSRRREADRTVERNSNLRNYLRYGTVLRFDRSGFEPTTGSQSELVIAPPDENRVFAGALVELTRARRFEKTTGVDSIRFTEDLSFGFTVELLAGVDDTRTELDNSETEPALFLEASQTFGSALRDTKDKNPWSGLLKNTFGNISFNGFTNLQSGADRSQSAGLTFKVFNRSISSNTLAARFDFAAADRGDDLPTEFTLGENNGLRGYATRQFSGTNRVRLNFEDRIFTGWNIGAIDVGLLAFFDAGWAGDDIDQLSLSTSAGVGLRLGSNPLLGRNVFRLDLAYPFNPVDGDSSLSLSVAMGQVFSF